MKTLKFYFAFFILLSTLFYSCDNNSESSFIEVFEERPIFNLEDPDEISDEEYLIYSLVIEDYFSERNQYDSISNYIIRQKSWNLSIEIENASLAYLPENHTNINPEVFENFNLKNINNSLFDTKFQVENKEIILISTAELQYVFKDKSITAWTQNWANLYEHYKNSYGLIYLTRIGFNNEKTQALFEFVLGSGPGSAEGWLLYLEKENSEWVIKENVIFWAE